MQLGGRLLLSLIIGLIIGLEREMHHKAAGLRTSVLICLGATIFTLVSLTFRGATGVVDPSRVAAGIVTGIGFLGAGTIIQTRGSVHGLTTAASIWVMAALGLAVGIGYWYLALIGAVLSVIVLNPFMMIERAVKGQKTSCTYTIRATDTGPALAKIMEALRNSPGEVKQLRILNRDAYHEIIFHHTDEDDRQCKFADELAKTKGVVEVDADQSQGE
jgi:putative Mg2+ transporter-C (MgtC) family protein